MFRLVGRRALDGQCIADKGGVNQWCKSYQMRAVHTYQRPLESENKDVRPEIIDGSIFFVFLLYEQLSIATLP